MINFLTGGVNSAEIQSGLGLPTVTTQDAIGKGNEIVHKIYAVVFSYGYDLGTLMVLFAIIALILVAVFAKKHIGKYVIGLVIVFVCLILLKEIPFVMGWVMNLAN